MSLFCAVGNITIDDLVFSDGETRMNVPGGNSVYAALGMRIWGAPTRIVSICGADYPTRLLERLGLDLGGLDTSAPRTLRNWGLYEEDGSRTFVFRGRETSWEAYSPLPIHLASGDCAHAHLAPLPFGHQLALAGHLRGRGATVTVDPHDSALAGLSEAGLRELLDLVDAFLPSRQDVAALYPDLDPLAALRRLRALAPELPVVAIKVGSDGVLAHARGERRYLRVPAWCRDAVDPTGAGDAFCGGFLYGYSRRRDPLEGVLSGSVSASFAVEGIGLSGLVEALPDEAERRLAALCRQVVSDDLM